MRAMYYEEFGVRPTIEHVADPVPAPDGVVVAVEASGVCRSDWNGWCGRDPDIALPHVPGHELAGRIAAVGTGVGVWTVGERVTVPFVGGCGHCETCRGGNPQVCPSQFQAGFTGWGSFAELVAIDHADANLVRIPDDIDSVRAAALGCRVATSYRAVVQRGAIREGEWLAVHGCGGVGLSAIMIGAAIGARVVAVDVDRSALAAAREAGAEHVIDATGRSPADLGAAVAAATAGGAHVSIDAIGGAGPSMASLLGLRRRGRHVQVGLMAGDDEVAAIAYSRVVGWELDVLGCHGMAASSYPAMFELVADGRIDLDRLVTRTVSLDDAVDALVHPDATGPGITVIDRFGEVDASRSAGAHH